jgi:NAD(P)-dependent dehydrogenase (short-subunit alcohol dehydrogenase family)
MTPIDATELLRPGLLERVALLVAGPPAPAGHGEAVAQAFSELGAQVAVCVPAVEDETAADGAVTDALAELGALHILVVDGAGLYARARDGAGAGAADGAPTSLRACMDATWNVTRAVVNLAFLPAPAPVQRILYLAPASDAGEHAEAVRAGLENLARTLSVEWARHGIAAVTIAPSPDTSVEEVAAVAAYLASPAGAYFSGCLLELTR